MTFWATRLLRPKTRANNPKPPIPFRPRLEVLEDRVVPALFYHGGPIIPNVQAQAVFLGSNWNQSQNLTQAASFDTFLQSVTGTSTTSSTFLNTLGAAGFTGSNGTVGSGNTLADVIDPVTIPVTNLQGYNNNNPLASANYTKTVLFDSQIQTDLETEINAGSVQKPGADSLYVVFVEPNVVVDQGNGANSINAFSAYHNSFTYDSPTYGNVTVAYSVTPYAGPISGSRYANSQAPWLSGFDSMTMVTSHELAEAVTDPYPVSNPAWQDPSGNEVGDLVNGSTVYLNGNAVQRVSAIVGSQADYLALTPAGSTAGHSVAFSLSSSGVLTKQETGGSSVVIATGVASISQQGVDDFGQPMIDVVFKNHNAYEYHDFLPGNPLLRDDPGFFPFTFLSSNVKQAVAGQGVSYVLLTNGNLGEYVDPNYATQSYGFGVNPTPTGTAVIASGVTSLVGAGLDASGGNTVTYTVNGATHLWDDVTGATPAGAVHAAVKTPSKRSDADGGFPTSQQGQVVAFVVPTFQAGLFPTTALTQAPTVLSATTRSATPPVVQPLPQFNRPDGGGSEELLPADAPTGLPLSDAPATLADIPAVGPILLEAGGQLKALRSMVPSGLLPAQPPKPAVPPVGPKGTPQSKAPESDRKGFAANALLALFSFGFAGLIHEDRRRRPPRG